MLEGTGAVAGGPRWILRLEALAIAAVSMAAYFMTMDLSWQMFAWLFLVPDISFAAYLAGPAVGARGYNLMHSFLGPLFLLASAAVLDHSLATGTALIWLAHIGVDRSFGYGLKYADAFGHTHLGLLGRFGRQAL